MPKLVSELVQGRSASRNNDGGSRTDTYTRKWRVILNSPNESYDIQAAIGVKVGDVHPNGTGAPCVSINETTDGDSRLVRIVDATYKLSAGASGSKDPNSDPPDIRPAKFSIASSLIEVPVRKWTEVVDGALQNPKPATNPAGDMYDGVSKLVPIINVSIEQYDGDPGGGHEHVGKINSDQFSFLGRSILKYTCMLRGIQVRPHVETFGDVTYRGFIRTYEFAVKPWSQFTDMKGWNILQPLSGYNIKNTGLGGATVDDKALVLELDTDSKVKIPFAIAPNLNGEKVRAMVPIAAPGSASFEQRPSSLPVPMNEDGSPRKSTANPPVLLKEYNTQDVLPFGNNFAFFNIRLEDII